MDLTQTDPATGLTSTAIGDGRLAARARLPFHWRNQRLDARPMLIGVSEELDLHVLHASASRETRSGRGLKDPDFKIRKGS